MKGVERCWEYPSEAELGPYGAEVGVDGRGHRDLADGDVRVLEPVPGEDAHHAGAGYILLAGRPGERRAAYESAGVDGFVYAGCDALAALTAVYDKIGARS